MIFSPSMLLGGYWAEYSQKYSEYSLLATIDLEQIFTNWLPLFLLFLVPNPSGALTDPRTVKSKFNQSVT